MTLKHTFPPLKDYHGVEVCVFMLGVFVCVGVFFLCKAQGDGAVNETMVLFQNTVTLQGLLL